jgi:glyoxylase-like metal-dependent hydrolase (beta-lactamase superfamily II)
MRWLRVGFVLALGIAIGLLFARTDAGQRARSGAIAAGARAAGSGLGAALGDRSEDVRRRVLLEHPDVAAAMLHGGGFGGEYSARIAQHMFARDPEAIAEARAKLRIENVAPRTWLFHLPWVNAVLFETDAGLVLVDTGYAPAGPAILDAIRRVSQKPLHTLIYTHGHVDHAFGAWALLEAGEKPEIVATEALPRRFERYLRLRGSLAKYMNQPVSELPRSRDDLVWPNRTFRDRLELEIGGERFVLVACSGETDDQLYVWVPSRRALASADYFQGFLPNAGNGKRAQRNVEAWAQGLRDMAALEPALLLPAHGDAIADAPRIRDELSALAAALESIAEQTIAGLNEGLRKDQVAARVALPPELANRPSLREYYVTPQNIAKMVIKQYTGWWDDLPSHWSPAPLEAEAGEIVAVAGGVAALDARARALLASGDLRLASHLADWAWYARPDDAIAQQLSIDVYAARAVAPETLVQERLVYLDRMTEARARQLARETGNRSAPENSGR